MAQIDSHHAPILARVLQGMLHEAPTPFNPAAEHHKMIQAHTRLPAYTAEGNRREAQSTAVVVSMTAVNTTLHLADTRTAAYHVYNLVQSLRPDEAQVLANQAKYNIMTKPTDGEYQATVKKTNQDPSLSYLPKRLRVRPARLLAT